ncbi:hypothetical protein TIN4_102 [Tsukamurella phage TIN4]|uniref:Uncharacterized protein n=2 Tax=Tinduovirus TIN3 TaxID=1982571 RepID=A0A0K0N678_9CAUD|nr:hypothetical protein AVT54_gp023 [Tsukamurella phage TIN3]YP_009604232.1 hypothetical protein FDH87_gp023 [Tsukamurella phage TIN4]AKJ71899.1 hypothetical protein TIN3_102 [Tsukamurella phage TIN3]AKJ72008.1 hypothetical protein TIN4_102 [Tsukamurella phage TIN4]
MSVNSKNATGSMLDQIRRFSGYCDDIHTSVETEELEGGNLPQVKDGGTDPAAPLALEVKVHLDAAARKLAELNARLGKALEQ